MKKIIKNTLLILLFLALLMPSTYAFGRAGGGGSGGGGGGGSSSSGRSRSSSTTRRRNTLMGNIVNIVFLGVGVAGATIGRIKYKAKILKKKSQSISAIKKFEREDEGWDYTNIKNDITDTFYKVQKAWMERDQSLAKDCMSEDIYKKHETKTNWMKIKGEKNILKDIKLLEINPVGAMDSQDDLNDTLWVNIKAEMIDYTINENTNTVVSGSRNTKDTFEEFWKFIRRNNRWVLDEIRQVEEVQDLNEFYNSKD